MHHLERRFPFRPLPPAAALGAAALLAAALLTLPSGARSQAAQAQAQAQVPAQAPVEPVLALARKEKPA
ncbi:MAG TPA: hypothetical protein PKA20_26130, partial [Burkholderiaceae bacterium]|nr:hypothetical protein [Burkholderiaceae bacterium]